MAFNDEIQPSPWAPNGGGNFLASDPNSFVFNSDGDWMDMSGWQTFWMSTFSPGKYKEKRDEEVAESLREKYKVNDGMSCGKLNDRIEDIEDRFDSEAGASPGGRGATRMQARNLKGLEPILNRAYDLAEDKCCEYSVCDSNKDRGRGGSDDTGDSGNGSSGNGSSGRGSGGSSYGDIDDIKADLLRELQSSPTTSGGPSQDQGMSTGMKIGLGVGGGVLLLGMAYLMFKGGR